MRAKILDYEAWDRLKLEAEHNPLCDYVSPENIDVVVVEEDGKIIASLGVMRVTHFEGLWVDPKHRGKPGVLRALFRQAAAIPWARNETWGFAGAAEGNMREFNERIGVRLPVDWYTVGIKPWLGNA